MEETNLENTTDALEIKDGEGTTNIEIEDVGGELKGENVKEEDEEKKPRDMKLILKVYFIPILAIMSFIFIIIGLIFPKISEIFEDFDEANSLQQTLTNKQTEKNLLEQKNNARSTIEQDLNILNSLAPAGETEVVQFQEKVEVLATQNDLRINSQRLNDQANEGENLNVLELKQIPNVFELSGKKSDILAFINDLSLIDDFVVVREMQFNGPPNDEDWRLELTIIKYQFGQVNSEILSTFNNIPIQSEVPETIREYIDAKTSNF